MTNFKNGALVFRVWSFDGSGEVIAKFQYPDDGEQFAKAKAADDAAKQPEYAEKPKYDNRWFYLVVCEAECTVKAFPVKPAPESAR